MSDDEYEPTEPNQIEEDGNTNPPLLNPKNQMIHWFFTWNNYPDNWKELFRAKEPLFQKLRIQTEIGKKGTPHLQGNVSCYKKRRWSEFELPKQIKWMKSRNVKACYAYCNKEKTSTGDFLEWGCDPPQKNKKPLKLISPDYPWEQEIIKIIETEPDDRFIYWYYDLIGGVGKTSFAKYLSAKYNAIPLDGRKNDILYTAAEYESDVYIYIPSRTIEHFSYDSLEKVKDGFFMCAKYESKPIVRNPPHVFVFANRPPDLTTISTDKWIVREITKVDP